MTDLAPNDGALKKRIRRLLHSYMSPEHGGPQRDFLNSVMSVGRLALIGGAVRDVARQGVLGFKSDLDFVLHKGDVSEFYHVMREYGARKNTFGGFRVELGRARIDIWALEDTWARRVGLRNVTSLVDLVDCTFFDWDAVIFDIDTGSLISRPNYLTLIASRTLELNLEENPNPKGSLVRAIRRRAMWRVFFGPRLRSFVERELERHSWGELVELDTAAFDFPVLLYCDPDRLREGLSIDSSSDGSSIRRAQEPNAVQLETPFSCSHPNRSSF